MCNRLRFLFLFLLLSLSACLRSEPAPSLDVLEGETVRFAVIGDYGTDSTGEADVAALVASWNVDFVATVGDNNYPAGEAATLDRNVGKYYQAFIGAYKGTYGPGSPGANRFWPALGNHDWQSLSCGAGCSGPYFDYFELPGNERYYDVRYGAVHLFILDSDPKEPDGVTSDSQQARWLKETLAASTAAHKLVLLHHAPYSSGHHGSNPTLQWPFEAWGATAVIAGHDHHFERLQVGAIPYFVNGAGGRARYALGSLLPESQIAYNQNYGAMLVSASETSVSYAFYTRDGERIDHYEMSASSSLLRRQVSASDDDAEESSGRMYRTSSDLELVSDVGLGYPEQMVGMRFRDLDLPRNAVIDEAYIEFTVDEPTSEPTDLLIAGEASDNASGYGAASYDLSSRALTAARVTWNAVPAWSAVGDRQRTPDLSTILQEIVDRPGWQSGGAAAFQIVGRGRRTAESYDGSPSGAPALVVRYQQGAPNRPPSLSSPGDQASFVGDAVDVRLAASDPDGDALLFSASGLPDGLSLEARTGRISGVPTVPGSFRVAVSVSDGRAFASATLTWQVAPVAGVYEGRVRFSEDDAEEYLDSRAVRITSSDLELAEENAPQAVAVRFRDVSVPAGAVVTRAFLSFTVDEAGTGAVDLRIRAEASDNAAAYSGAAGDISSRSLSATSVGWWGLPDWSPSETHVSPELSGIVQEIVDRPGWRAGNALAFVISGTGTRTAESFDGSSSGAPRLTIEYRARQATRSTERRIGTGGDDVEERANGSLYRNSSDLELTADGDEQTVGLRFAELNVPQGARVVSAYVQFKTDERSSTPTRLEVRAEAADDAAPFAAGWAGTRVRGRSAVTWSPPAWDVVGAAGSGQRTPNLAAIVQEVVERPGWRPGNALTLIVSGNGRRVAESFEGDAAGAPLLHITYE